MGHGSMRAAHEASCLSGGGTMGRFMREHDWQYTAVGPVATWPQSLRTSVSILLESKFPMYIAWGEDYVQFYNDGYLPIMGATKHPQALGISARETFPEIWPIIGPMFEDVRRGQAFGYEDYLLPLDRNGYLEECYFTFSYSPIRDESSEVGGIMVTTTETTARVIGERRLAMLGDLATLASHARSEEEIWSGSENILRRNPADLAFCLLYRSTGAQSFILEHCCGLTDDGVSDGRRWPLLAMMSDRQPVLVDDVMRRFGPVLGSQWPDPVQSALQLPVGKPGSETLYGALVVGISPRKALDDQYRSFLSLVSDHIGSGISNVRAYEEERRRAMALAEIDKAKTTFFSNVSHEFRTPLTLMIGPLEDALVADVLPSAQRERLEMAHRNSLRLLKLVNSLLDFARIEEGRMRASYQQTDLATFTAELASNFRSACERAGLTLLVDCEAIPEPVYVDRVMWEKIVLNLLSNAFKFTFEGEIAVRLCATAGHVELSVCDTGVGIPDAEVPRLFERFHRIEGQRSRSFEGSGIGLALVQELVKLHGGAISVKSEPDRGSTFTVSVPLGAAHLPKEQINTADAGMPAPARAAAYIQDALNWLGEQTATAGASEALDTTIPANARWSEQTHILLADDNADMRGYVHRLLGTTCKVETVKDGQEALEAISRRPPDLVLADVMMPRRDGFSLLRAIRSDARLSEIPVILLSARAGEESRVQGLEAGADDYLVKPFSARELTARVSSILELSRVRRDAITAVRESERRIRAMFQQAPSFICILRGPEHVFEFANDAYVRMVGADRNLIGNPVREAVPEVEGQGYLELLDEVYRSGKAFKGAETPLRVRRTSDGPLMDVLIDFIYQPITDAAGLVNGIFVEGFEVTDRVTAQAALRQSEERYRTLFDSIDEGFCIVEAMPAANDYQYIAINRALEGQSGIAAKVGDTVRGLLSTEAQGWIDIFDEILRTGEPVRGERELVAQGRVLDLYSFRLEDESNRRIGVIFTDVTARKRAEAELLRANQALEQFAYSASHDLQEPLRNIKIYSELLSARLKDQLSGDNASFLDFVTTGATRMELLVRDLLAFTQASLHEPPSAPIQAGEALASALANLEQSIKESGANVSSGPLPALRVHATQLQQLFQNLVGNAIKYRRPDVQPVVMIEARRENDMWLFSVSDNGIGIESEYKERVFGLFKRLHTGQEYSGTGIGLAICQRIVERYHGRIWVESEPGKGSKFLFTLPGA